VENDNEWIVKSVQNFQQNLLSAGLSHAQVEPEQFLRWFDLAGLQRHLKCVGIFHRLKIRDGKPEYMQDVPRILGYIHQVLEQHTELGKIKQLVNQATILE
jgi:aminoglycoside/choline kinase family phosphotransferase